MRLRRLSTRILLFFLALMVAVQLTAFLLYTHVTSINARAKVEAELDTGQKLFERTLAQNSEQLAQTAHVLAADFGFREAIATRDLPTLASALENHGARIGAALTLYLGLDGSVVARSESQSAGISDVLLPQLVAKARTTGRATALDSVDGNAYQLVAVPVQAPITIGYVALGFKVDNRLALELKKLSNIDVTLLSGRRDTPGWQALASTLPDSRLQALIAALPPHADGDTLRHLKLQDGDYQIRIQPLNGGDGHAQLIAVLQRSYASALAGYDRLLQTLALLGFGSLLASVLGAVAISLNITRPLGELLVAAKRITQGDYATPVAVRRSDEIGSLADSLDHMRDGIGRRESEILRLAYRDHLTGLPNRSMFGHELTAAIERADATVATVGVLMMDLDRFRVVNETLGHGVGDHVLCQVAERVGNLLGNGALLARLGGDEFAILLPDGANRAFNVAASINRVLETPILYEGQPLDVGASIGVALYPEHGRDAVTLLRHADAAMYQAKKEKSGCVLYDPRGHSTQQRHLSLLGELRRAVDRDELRLCYQPKLSLDGNTVAQLEALVRWQHPDRGMVAPVDFIPFAEFTGHIKLITRWVLREAIAQCGRWLEEGLSLGIAVNLSTSDLMARDLPDFIQRLLAEHRVAPQLISLEITESGFMDDPAHALQLLQRLSGMGLRLAIDDYGTGYSSLSYLMRLPVDELKIDRSFVASMVGDPALATIVRSTIDLGHNLGLRVVAEGVESAEGLQMLRDLGCDAAQGYYISRPLFAADLQLWLQASGFAPAPAAGQPPARAALAL